MAVKRPPIMEEAYSEKTIAKRHEITVSHKKLLEAFGIAAHIKEKYVSFIGNMFIKTLRRLILENFEVKVWGLGTFTFIPRDGRAEPFIPEDPNLFWNNYYKRWFFDGFKENLIFYPSQDFVKDIVKIQKENNLFVNEPIFFSEDKTSPPSKEYMKEVIGKNIRIRDYQIRNGLLQVPFKYKTDEEVLAQYKEIFGEEDIYGKAND